MTTVTDSKMINTYQPKGGMCLTCAHKDRNCSHLKFDEMKVIQKELLAGVIKSHIVICTEHVRPNLPG